MDNRLIEANRLEGEGRDEEALELLRDAVAEDPGGTRANFAYACSLDRLGHEQEAISHYERAIERGLEGEDLETAKINLGSSYRVMGDYGKAVEVWREGLESFPENRALQAFLSMGLYNSGDYREAMELLLRNLAETSTDPWISRYERAIKRYADELDEGR